LTVSVPWAAAEPKEHDRRKVDAEVRDVLAVIGPLMEGLGATEARTQDAPRLLTEALRSGTTDTAAWASIVRWVLFEKEEKVAAGLTEALHAAPPPADGPDAARWNRTAEAVIGAFAGVLRDAQSHTRRDGDAIVNGLAAAAAPAVIAAISESDPRRARQGPGRGPGLRARHEGDGRAPGPGLRHADSSCAWARPPRSAPRLVRAGRGPGPRAALDDPDAGVREAPQALARIPARVARE
jgi:hypothetical protein